MGKEKLTLSVDKEVVEKAKKLGINISDITENILKGYTSAEKPNGSLYDAYQQLFSSILPLLREFQCSVQIAESVDVGVTTDCHGKTEEVEFSIAIFLEPDGSFYIDDYDQYLTDIRKIPHRDFFSPERIILNVVDSLAKSKEANEEKMQQIMMAKRIIDAMSETLIKKATGKSDEKG
jgi:hypothetical protein